MTLKVKVQCHESFFKIGLTNVGHLIEIYSLYIFKLI